MRDLSIIVAFSRDHSIIVVPKWFACTSMRQTVEQKLLLGLTNMVREALCIHGRSACTKIPYFSTDKKPLYENFGECFSLNEKILLAFFP